VALDAFTALPSPFVAQPRPEPARLELVEPRAQPGGLVAGDSLGHHCSGLGKTVAGIE